MTTGTPDPRNRLPDGTRAAGEPTTKDLSTVQHTPPKPPEPFYARSITAADEFVALAAKGATPLELQQFMHNVRLDANSLGVLDGIAVERERAGLRLRRMLQPGRN